MNERIFNKVLTLLIAGAIICSIIYGLYCLLGLIGSIIYCCTNFRYGVKAKAVRQ